MIFRYRALQFTAFFCVAAALAAAQSPSATPAPRDELQPGLVIEKVARYSQAEKAGLTEGDIVLRWNRMDAKGEIESPFDLVAVEIEQAPRGNVTLEGLHGKENKVWSLGQDTWGIQARPNFAETLQKTYREGQELAAAGKLNEAAERWRAIAGGAESADPSWLRAWLFFHIAQMQTEARQWKEADEAYQEAVGRGAAAGPEVAAQMSRSWGNAYEQRSDWPHAEQYYRQAMAAKENTGGENLARAVDLDHLGSLNHRRGDLRKADDYYQQALHTREKLAPDSLCVASSLNNLGYVAENQGDLEKADDFDHRALTIGEKLAPGSLTVATALGNLGDVGYDHGNLAGAEDYYRRSLGLREKLAPDSLDVATALNRLGGVAWKSGDLAKAEEYYRRGLEIREKLAPDSLSVAISLNSLGNVARKRGDLEKTEAYYHRALEIREKLAPGSVQVAGTLLNLGNVALDRGDLDKAEQYYRQSLTTFDKLAPGGPGVANALINLGIVAWQRGDPAKADEYYRQGLTIWQRLAPNGLDIAPILDGLGVLAGERGDLAKAEDYDLQSLAIRQRLAPGSLEVTYSLNNLGLVAWQRGDLVKAEDYQRQALAIRQRLAPGGLDVAVTLASLVLIALDRGDLAKAEELSWQALTIFQKAAPNSLRVAVVLNNLGQVTQQGGDLAKAENFYQQALDIREKLAPGSVDLAWNLNRLGSVVQQKGDLERAEQYYRRAFAIWEKLAPASANEAESLAGLASIMRQHGQLDSAAQLYEQALNALGGQTIRLGGTEDVRAGFRAKYESYHEDYAAVLMSQGKTDLAFEVLERARAQTLLEMLSSAHLDIHQGAEPSLLASERSLRENITAKSDRRMRLLSNQHTEKQLAEVDKELGGLRDQYQAVEAHIRTASPGYAALTQPEPLTAGQIRQLLDHDTALLEYSLGDERSYLFVVTPDSVHAYELPKRAEIERAARGVYDLLTARNHAIKGETPQQQQARAVKAELDYSVSARQLSNLLLGPAGATLQGKRLLIVADGALHYIPFAALPDPQDLSRIPAPLMVAHEIVNLPSASVLAVIRRQEEGRKPAPKAVAVLADPVFSVRDGRLGAAASPRQDQTRPRSESATDAGSDRQLTRSMSDVGIDLSRLPYTRREAEAICALAPPHQGMKALDFNATRAAAMGPDLSQYRIIHFATHGLLDSQHPELSGLVLSLVDKRGKPQSGFLSLEDIYNLNLGAELVVLSACETGLGKEIDGEGLIGLTRGFMYAGANRVVASLWSVNDVATADLMTRFYRGVLHDRLAPASALRQAQVQMWRNARWKSPYYWAAFQIQGDWK